MTLMIDSRILEDVEKVVIDYDKLWKSIHSDVEEIVILALTKKENRYLKVLKLINCKNLSSEPSMFIADPNCVTYALALCRALDCIPMIIHSHRVSCMPSKIDEENMKLWNTVWLIISTSRKMVCAWLAKKNAIQRVEVEHTGSQRFV